MENRPFEDAFPTQKKDMFNSWNHYHLSGVPTLLGANNHHQDAVATSKVWIGPFVGVLMANMWRKGHPGIRETKTRAAERNKKSPVPYTTEKKHSPWEQLPLQKESCFPPSLLGALYVNLRGCYIIVEFCCTPKLLRFSRCVFGSPKLLPNFFH